MFSQTSLTPARVFRTGSSVSGLSASIMPAAASMPRAPPTAPRSVASSVSAVSRMVSGSFGGVQTKVRSLVVALAKQQTLTRVRCRRPPPLRCPRASSSADAGLILFPFLLACLPSCSLSLLLTAVLCSPMMVCTALLCEAVAGCSCWRGCDGVRACPGLAC